MPEDGAFGGAWSHLFTALVLADNNEPVLAAATAWSGLMADAPTRFPHIHGALRFRADLHGSSFDGLTAHYELPFFLESNEGREQLPGLAELHSTASHHVVGLAAKPGLYRVIAGGTRDPIRCYAEWLAAVHDVHLDRRAVMTWRLALGRAPSSGDPGADFARATSTGPLPRQ